MPLWRRQKSIIVRIVIFSDKKKVISNKRKKIFSCLLPFLLFLSAAAVTFVIAFSLLPISFVVIVIQMIWLFFSVSLVLLLTLLKSIVTFPSILAYQSVCYSSVNFPWVSGTKESYISCGTTTRAKHCREENTATVSLSEGWDIIRAKLPNQGRRDITQP